MKDNNYIPVLFIRKMLAYFKLNFASQTFIEEEVPSLKKVLSYPKKDIPSACMDALNTLFSNHDLDLVFDVQTKEIDENTYELIINVTHEEDLYSEKITIEDSSMVDEYSKHREELFLDRGYM